MSSDHKGDFARCSDDTRRLRVAKELLYAENFPAAASRSLVDAWFQAEKFSHFRGLPSPVFLPAPSTTGQNLLPLLIAEKLQSVFGGVVLDSWATTTATTRTSTLSGFEKMRHPPHYAPEPSVLRQIPPGATLILVDDVVTTGGTISAMRESLAREGLSVSHVASLAQSDLRLVRDADIDRITAKLGEPALRPDIALVLDGRLKHFSNYLEISIRKTDAQRNSEISSYFRSEASRLRELGRSHAGAILGIPERVERLALAQSARGPGSDLVPAFPRAGGDVQLRSDAPQIGSLSPEALLKNLDVLRAQYADQPTAALSTASSAVLAFGGPALTAVPLRIGACDFVAGVLSRADLLKLATSHAQALALSPPVRSSSISLSHER